MLAMHPQNNNHDIISEHELKKKILVYKRLQRRVVLMKWVTDVKTFANFFYCFKAEKYESICICFW